MKIITIFICIILKMIIIVNINVFYSRIIFILKLIYKIDIIYIYINDNDFHFLFNCFNLLKSNTIFFLTSEMKGSDII